MDFTGGSNWSPSCELLYKCTIFFFKYETFILSMLNELEFIDGEVWANVWQSNRIVRIDPTNGQVVGSIDLTGLLDPATITQRVDVLNGIAYDEENGRLFITGKFWPTLFKIVLVPQENN